MMENNIDISSLTAEQLAICAKLTKLHMKHMSDKLMEQFSNPNNEFISFEKRIAEIINCECDSRAETKFQKMLKASKLKYKTASLDEKLKLPERKINQEMISKLAECSWIKAAKVLSITGATGTGKSYIACALGISAIRQNLSVRYFFTNDLISEMTLHSKSNDLIEFMNIINTTDLLILDDFGYSSEINAHNRHVDYHRIFEILNARENRKATIIASQIPRVDWYDLFKEDTYADACMDRIVKGNYLLELFGPSLRG